MPKISDYGLIGDCRSAALVSNKGSIDWLCLPDFDSEAVFCKNLDQEKGGYFSISPRGNYLSSQIYKDQTNILKTDFFNYSGRVLLTDFMPITRDQERNRNIPASGVKIIRRVKAKLGDHHLRVELRVTPGFAKEEVQIQKEASRIIFKTSSHQYILHSNQALLVKVEGNLIIGTFDLHEGEEAFLAFSFAKLEEQVAAPTLDQLKDLYNETRNFWGWWASICTYKGLFEKEIIRSALTLKMLTFNPTGAVIAAPTTSLPEKLGGGLNWDYRYVWLRDASFTMYALLGLGYLQEAVDFMGWLEAVCLADEENIQIMYGLRGEKDLAEKELKHLSGFEKSKPVRVGNGAAKQLQLDVFGEVLVVIYLFVVAGGELSDGMEDFVIRLVNKCCKSFEQKDASIWEPRGDYQHFTYSKLMCWAGIDRGIRLADTLKLKVDHAYWEKTKRQIESLILKEGFDEDLQAFVQIFGKKTLDSSSFNIPILGFLPANDPKVAANFDTTTSKLSQDWFIFRSNDDLDHLKAGEGTFFLSTFWAIDNLSTAGKVKEAKIWIEKMIAIATPLGLYAEMYDPINKEHLGNFPQAFTHLGLINSVLNLNQAMKFGGEKKATTGAQRLKNITSIFNTDISETIALIVPLEIRKTLSEAERRRTARHSLFGKIIQKIKR